MTTWFAVAVAGLGIVVGVVSAALGIGGGIVMVPAFREVLAMDPHTAKGTSLFAIVFVAAVNIWRLYRGQGRPPWELGAVIASGAIVGGYIGAWVTKPMSGNLVTWIFVALMAFLALRTFLLQTPTVGEEDVRRRHGLAVMIGLVTGLVSGMTGIGGGLVFVPLALLAGIVSNARVSALSNLVMVGTCLAASMAHFRADQRFDGLPGTFGQVNVIIAPPIFVGAQVGGPFGKWLNGRLTLPRRRVVMGALLILIAVRLTLRALKPESDV